MEKVLYQDDHQQLIQAAGGMKFQMFEKSDTMTKSASECFDKATIQEHMPDDNHWLMHVIAMGADETYGFNRNGDGFNKQALAKYHPTFVSNGHFYREHRNRCPETQGIGMIKHSAYNEQMDRVELLVWGDKRKAEEEYEMAKSGSELSFSMSARLPGDECSCCGNFSRNLGQYCSHLKNHMGQYIPEMKKYAYAKNNNNVLFYDISRVGKPADRIAHYLSYRFGDDEAGMAKAASVQNSVIPGAAWAEFEGTRLGDHLVQWDVFEQGMLEKLAAYEQKHNNFDKQAGELNDYERIMVSQVAPSAVANHEMSQEDIDTLRAGDHDLPNIFGELCKQACVLGMDDFSSLVTGKSKDCLRGDDDYKAATEARLPSLFSDIMGKGCDCGEAEGLVSPSSWGCSFEGKKDMLDDVMDRVADSMGMEDDKVKSRATQVIVIKQASHKDVDPSSNTSDFHNALVDAYGAYVIKNAAFISRHTTVGAELLPAVLTAMIRK